MIPPTRSSLFSTQCEASPTLYWFSAAFAATINSLLHCNMPDSYVIKDQKGLCCLTF
jgi:hypothetical protein